MKQKGFILIASLFLLAIITMIGISMFGGFSTDEKMSGNYREKSRSRDAAQTALNAAAYWMSVTGNTYTGSWNTGSNCVATASTPVICSNALASPATPSSWTSYVTYTPSGMNVSASGGAPVANVSPYAATPSYYIQFLGQLSPTSALYRTTAAATGGNAEATSVLQTVYVVTAKSINIDQ